MPEAEEHSKGAKACKCTSHSLSEPFLLPLHADLPPLMGLLIIVTKRPELFGDLSRGRGVLKQLLQASVPSQQQALQRELGEKLGEGQLVIVENKSETSKPHR